MKSKKELITWINSNLWKVFAFSIFITLLIIYKDFWLDCINNLWVRNFASKCLGYEWWIILICFTIISLYYIRELIIARYVNWKRLSIIVVFIVLYYYCLSIDRWEYSKFSIIDYNIEWSHLLVSILAIFEIIVSIKLCFYKKRSSDETPELEIEKVRNVVDRYERKGFYKSTYEILKTCYSEECCYSISIVGQWGSGKTTFLNFLQEEFSKGDEISVIQFEPWKSETTDGIIKDFFTLLRNELSLSIPNISFRIDEYIELLVNDESTKILKVLGKLFNQSHSTKSDLYDDIKHRLTDGQRKTVVFIDDLDRLNSKEIKEVLGLIRNTANFPYLQFILALDKQYVCDALELDGIKNPDLFLEKFFNAEILLPKYEDRIICEEVLKRMSKTISNIWGIQENDNRIYEMIFYYGHGKHNGLLVPRILLTIRDVIRFNNSFKIISKTYKDIAKEINFQDLFLIELLHYRYPHIYSELRNNPLSLLDLGNDSYSFKVNEEKTKIKDFCEDKEKAKVAEEILSQLFSNNKNSISVVRNFDKYFMYRLDEKRLTISEFIHLESINDIDFGKSVDSLYEKKYPSEFKAILREILNQIFVISKEKAANFNYKNVYKIITQILTHSNSEYLKTEVSDVVLEHLINSFHIDYKQLQEKLELFHYIDFKAIKEKDSKLLNLLTLLLFKDNLAMRLHHEIGKKETDIIRNFLLKSSSVEAVKEQLSVLITTVHNQKNINENNLVIPIAELKKIVS